METDNQDPSYWIMLVDKENKKRKTNAGVAFRGPFDTFRIVLNHGIVLDGRVMETCWINLVPWKRWDRGEARPNKIQPGSSTSGGGSDDDDIPF